MGVMWVVYCKLCGGKFNNSPDSVVICGHHKGVVHLGCCIDNCSWDKKPCIHCHGVYDKL